MPPGQVTKRNKNKRASRTRSVKAVPLYGTSVLSCRYTGTTVVLYPERWRIPQEFSPYPYTTSSKQAATQQQQQQQQQQQLAS